ncbi:hypothetical protein V494_03353 [Pseudogymnoascus sp. VKM F-4513 (FW-928)]|nr:hypothetical protein V494_03353 [Pseudogymnoascus sp. VKM F-4513 (FW-928)]
MALARSASGPGALSINVGSANSFGSTNTSSQAPAAGGLFGKATMSQPTGGLFGQAQTTQPQTTQGSGLFGASTTTSQPAQTGGLFGAASTAAPQSGGLFGAASTAAPQSGGLFGSAPASTQPQSSGLFGGQAAQTPASTGGMFGSTQAQQPQAGGLFGGANTQNQAKPSLFGGASTPQPQQQQQQQPQSSLFSSSARPQQSTGAFGGSFAGGLTMGQSQSQPAQATVPGVRIDLSNLRNTTRFNDLNEELQKKIEEFDAGVLSLMAKGDQCTAILPAHGEQLELVPDNVDFLQRKVIGVQANLDGDVQAVSQTSKQVYVDGENAKLSFTVVDNLKLPQQFHTGIWNPSKPSPSASKPGEAAGDLVTFFSQTSDEMDQTISTYKENISEIELHLRGVERSLMQAGSNIGRNGQDKNEVENLVGVLRDFEMGILEVAGRVGGAREGVQSLQLGHFIDPVSVNGNGKRRGVYYAKNRSPFGRNIPIRHHYNSFLNYIIIPDTAAMSSQEEGEEPIVEYARFHGLSIDPLRDPLPLSHIESLFHTYEKDISDSHLKQIEYRPIPEADGHLTIDKGAEILLAGASGVFLDQNTIDKITKAASTVLKRRRLKLELPLLKTDPDTDIRAFKQQQNPCISDANFIYEPLDNEKGEGPQWSSRFVSLPKAVLKECSTERITVTRETMVYLQDGLKDSWSREDTNELLRSQFSYEQNSGLDPVTPPLSPQCWATPEPFEPSSPTSHLQLLSDPPSISGAELKDIEKGIFEADGLISIEEEASDCNSPIGDHHGQHYHPRDKYLETSSLASDELFPDHGHKTLQGLKVDPPLTPSLPLAKTVTFSDSVEEMLFDQDFPGFTSSTNDSGNEDSLFMNHTLYDTFREAYETGNSRLEREQLQEAATTGRVEVPVMDFTAPKPPWNVSKLNGFSDSISRLQEILKPVMTEIELPDYKKNMRKLNYNVSWPAIPASLANVALAEEFGNEDTVLEYITSATDTDVTRSADLTYKTPGLRILRDDDADDEDLEPGVFPHEELDMSSLVKKRRLELGEDMGDNKTREKIQKSGELTMHTQATKPFQKPIPKMVPNSNTVNEAHENGAYEETLIGGVFSATTALDNFMEMRGTKRHKPTDSAYFPTSKDASIDNPAPLPTPPPIVGSRLTKADISLPLSNIAVSAETTSYIVSTELLKQRPLFSAIKSLIPTAQFIERDFNRYNTTAWLSQGTITRYPVRSPLSAEADIILSPSTGVVLTTLMKIKQKPLPGQKEKSEIKSKVEAICVRYERLLIFISEASPDESSAAIIGGQECMAMAEFMGFCASLPCTVNVSFVPGGHETLANWVVAGMVRYGSSSPFSLLEDETQWEVFLRRCGMNSYAAQAVVSSLRAPEGVHPSRRGLFGIGAFVGMGHSERIHRFSPVLEGERVLGRVSSVVDARWRHDTP